MSQTIQQEPGAAPTKVRKDWELFWRIIATLMVVVIGWILWVLYQITPRSVVTPLVYESQVKHIGTQASSTSAEGTIGSPQPAVPAPAIQAEAAAAPQVSPEAEEAALAMDQAQAAARSGAHQASADIQAAALEKRQEELLRAEQRKREGLKLSPEITTPLAGKKKIPKR